MTDGIITGKGIMDRWGITAFQLQDVLREGELVAVQDDLITRRTPESDPCLFCDGVREPSKDLPFGLVVSCQYGPEMDWHQCAMALNIVDRFEHMVHYHELQAENTHPSLAKSPRCISQWEEGKRRRRIRDAKFLLFELEVYEKASGMRQPEEERDVASRQRLAQAKEDERQQILLDLAMGYVRERGERVTNDELLKFLCRNSQEEVSVRAMKEVWKNLPPEAKKGPGRPKKEI